MVNVFIENVNPAQCLYSWNLFTSRNSFQCQHFGEWKGGEGELLDLQFPKIENFEKGGGMGYGKVLKNAPF